MIQVTQKHIGQGKRGSCEYCPVALALSEHHPGVPVKIHGSFGNLGGKWLKIGPKLEAWIFKYDHDPCNARPVTLHETPYPDLIKLELS